MTSTGDETTTLDNKTKAEKAMDEWDKKRIANEAWEEERREMVRHEVARITAADERLRVTTETHISLEAARGALYERDVVSSIAEREHAIKYRDAHRELLVLSVAESARQSAALERIAAALEAK